MEHAKWNEQEINAADIAENIELECKIREVSSKELFCPDPECENPVLRYCRGEKKRAYFAHLHNSNCDYAQFDRLPSLIRELRYKLFDIFKKKGYDVKIEQKILDHHYTHLLLKDGNKSLAIDIGRKSTTMRQITDIQNAYTQKCIESKWIVIDEIKPIVQEDQLYFLKRYELNYSSSGDLFVIDEACQQVAQYKLDETSYPEQGRSALNGRYGEVFCLIGTIEDLCLEQGQLTLPNFSKSFDIWVSDKKRMAEQRAAEESAEELNRQKRPIQAPIAFVHKPNTMRGISFGNTQEDRDQAERIRIAKEKSERELAAVTDRFKRYPDKMKKDILEYTKKISDIQDFSYRGITNDTPMDDAFANIFSMLPQYKRDQIIRRMDRIYW